MTPKLETNPEKLPRVGEFRIRGEKEGQTRLVEEWERILSSLCFYQRSTQYINSSFAPCSKKTKRSGSRWEIEMLSLLLTKAELLDMAS